MATPSSQRRLARELAHIQADGVSPTVHVAPHSGDFTTIDALIIGPPDTPYDGAMLHFRLKVPPDYPLKPPQVKFLSTDGGTLRIHPQLYADGKVCLSILGTWHGPKWSAILSLRNVLLSIQSLLNEEPLRCEPGLEDAPSEAVERANVFVAHESARVLVMGALTGEPSWGSGEDFSSLTSAMRLHLASRRAPLLERLARLGWRHDGQVLRDPFTLSAPASGRRCDFQTLHARLSQLLPSTGGDTVPRLVAQRHSEGAEEEEGEEEEEAADEEESEEEQEGEESEEEEPEVVAGSGDESETAEGSACACRICHQTAEESGRPLIAPCRCSGSIRYAHAQCLLDWLLHSSAASSSNWRCDICRTPFVVRLGDGRPPGLAFLDRDLDVFVDDDFEAPGLVAVLYISFLQILLTSTGRVAAQALLRFASLVCSPLPSGVGYYVWYLLSMPGLLLDIVCNLGYMTLCFGKGAIFWSGANWQPSRWGTFGEEQVAIVLNAISDGLGFAIGMNLDGFLLLSCYFSFSHICGMAFGESIAVAFARKYLGGNRLADSLLSAVSSANSALDEVPVPVLGTTAPAQIAEVMRMLQRPFSLGSLVLNVAAIGLLLKRAFFDAKPMPVDVLPRGAVRRADLASSADSGSAGRGGASGGVESSKDK